MAGKPSVNQDSFVSSIWLLLSLVCAFAGYLHCRSDSYSYEFKCDQKICNVYGTGQAPLSFPSADLIKATIIEIAKPKPDQGEKVVRTLQISYNTPAEPGSRFKVTKNIQFTPHDIGEVKAKTGFDAVQDYKRADAKRIDKVHLQSNKSTSTPGLALMIAGSVSAVLSIFLGTWSKHRIDYSKKSY